MGKIIVIVLPRAKTSQPYRKPKQNSKVAKKKKSNISKKSVVPNPSDNTNTSNVSEKSVVPNPSDGTNTSNVTEAGKVRVWCDCWLDCDCETEEEDT